jgi:predicted RNase H-like HicB family nuclease
MERHFEYPAKIKQDSAGFYLVTFPDFPEAATDARSLKAAIADAVDCLEEAVAGRMKRGEDIPLPSPAAKGTADHLAGALCNEGGPISRIARSTVFPNRTRRQTR